MNRTATKRQRLLLWTTSDGVCAICGIALDENFHADHRTPWWITRTTNVHEMQALCAPCNERKGTQMLRAHQETFDDLCRTIVGGERMTDIIAAVTPGGGKSLLPVIAAHRLITAGRADRICWVVPRLSLGVQGERAFMAKDMRGLLGHSLEIRASTNEPNPSRDKCGFVTTYQAIAQEPRLHIQEFMRHRYILVLDEPHHVAADGVWHRALQPIYDLAVLRVMMSGSLERSDGQPIAFLPYSSTAGGPVTLDLNETDTRKVIRYSLKQALAAHAVVPMYFEFTDGNAEWIDRKAQSRKITSLADAGNDTSAALYTAVSSDYAKELLSNAVEHWIAHRANFNNRAKLLVVAASINHARTYLAYLRDMGVDAALATSDDSDKALENIERIKGHKKPPLDVLVTVAMAYEGLDVRAITHIACLTHVRAKPWIEQMLARATRFDEEAGPWHDQAAHIFAPDDELFRECIAAIKAAQDPFIKERESMPSGGGATDRRDFVPILPIAANATSVRASGFQEGDVVDAEDYKRITRALKAHGLQGVSIPRFKAACDDVMKSYQETTPTAEPPVVDTNVDEQTPSQREERWKAKIQRLINEMSADRCHKNAHGEADRNELQTIIQQMGGNIIRMHGKSRTVMSEKELKAVWETRAVWSGFLDEGRRASSH